MVMLVQVLVLAAMKRHGMKKCSFANHRSLAC